MMKIGIPCKRIQRPCECRCGKTTAGGHFLPGHDTKTLSAILKEIGGILSLRNMVEAARKIKIEVEVDVNVKDPPSEEAAV